MRNDSQIGSRIKRLRKAFEDETKTQKALLIMVLGTAIALGIGFGLPVLVDERTYPYPFQVIGIASALFTIAGFWAVYFQLQSVKEVKQRREFEVLKAVGELRAKQLVGQIARVRFKLLFLKKRIEEGNYIDFLSESDQIIQQLELIRSSDWMEQTDKRLIFEFIHQHQTFGDDLREYNSQDILTYQLSLAKYLSQISYIDTQLINIMSKLESISL